MKFGNFSCNNPFFLFLFKMSNVENLSPQIIRQVVREMNDINTNSPEGIKVQINEADVTDIQGVIEGPGKYRNILLDEFLILIY